jgi:predicted ATPase
LIEYLRDKRTLLVLDNFEQLLPAAPLTSTLLEGSPNLRVLVSSRSVLRVYGEQEFPVPPLALPDHKGSMNLTILSQFEAVKLFIERAVAAKPDFQASNENAPAIAGICERVDGLPLAIELAAARIKLFSPQALLARLEKSLSALGTGARDAPTRQQTLRSAIEWSYDLLDAPGRGLFERFSVFARGANLEQAESVCANGIDVLDGLDQLADQSLLRRQPDFSEPRFLMLQTIKEFAFERLEASGNASDARSRHLDAFIALAKQAQPYFFGEERRQWLDRLELDHDNFRAALEWALAAGSTPKALSLAALLWRFWQMRGHIHEGRNRLAAVLAMPGVDDYRAEHLAALEAAGSLAYWQNDMPAAQVFYDECLRVTREIGDKHAIAQALYNDAFPGLVARVDADRIGGLFSEAAGLFRELGDNQGLARALWGLGGTYYYSGDLVNAKPTLKEAERLSRAVNDQFNLGWVLQQLGFVAYREGNLDEADRAFSEGLRLFEQAQDLSGIAFQLDNLSAVARGRGDPVRATRIAAAAEKIRATSGAVLGGRVSELEGRNPREGLNEADGEKAWQEGQALSVEQAVAYALGRALDQAERRA